MKIIKYKNFEVRPLAGALGAEILDINLNKIDDETFNEIYKAFIDYQVIGIPNQNLSSDEYLEFVKLDDKPEKGERKVADEQALLIGDIIDNYIENEEEK